MANLPRQYITQQRPDEPELGAGGGRSIGSNEGGATDLKAACDRCRGQKLRCVRDGSSGKCRRCTRAKSACTVPPRRPMGRRPSQVPSFAHPDSASLRDTGVGSAHGNSRVTSSSASPVDPAAKDHLHTSAASLASSSANLPNHGTDRGRSIYAQSSLFALDAVPFVLGTTPTMSTPAPASSRGALASDIWALPASFADSVAPSHSLQNHGTSSPNANEGQKGEGPAPSPATDRQRINFTKQLCDLHIAVLLHPLHDDAILAVDRRSRASLADLALGRLFALTAQTRRMIKQIPTVQKETVAAGDAARAESSSGRGDRQRHHVQTVARDRATALLALSIYTRLETAYTHACCILQDLAQNGGDELVRADDFSYALMPELSIDGFSLGSCHDFQLRLVMQICEQLLDNLRQAIAGINGPGLENAFADCRTHGSAGVI